MELRTYYWAARIRPFWFRAARELFKGDADRYFRVGNVGDILVKDLIEWHYRSKAKNVDQGGKRILLIGSISHRLDAGDVLVGIGSKGEVLPPPPKDLSIFGLRGPITLEHFRKSGYDVSEVKFLYDPGLLIKYIYDFSGVTAVTGKVGFIPHYRERSYYKKTLTKNISIIDVDNPPEVVAREILSCELIYSSSLHGVIFSHALGRACHLVMPLTEEPLVKYEDYFMSVGLPFPQPILQFDNNSIFSKFKSPDDVAVSPNDFYFPSLDFLKERGVAC